MHNNITKKTRQIVTAILLLSTFISLMSQTMMLTALNTIQHDMNVPLTTVQWLTTGYILIIGIVTPLSSNFYEKYSNRKVFLTTVFIFILGTIIGCFATNFPSLLFSRLLQAAASGIIMSFQMTAMISLYPPEKRGSVLGLSALVASCGPALGPTLGGIIVTYFGWHYLFILVLPIMVALWIIAFYALPNFSTTRDIKIDLISVILSLLGSSLALISISIFKDAPLYALIMLIIGIIILAVFAKRQLKLDNPMIKVTLLKNPAFLLLTLCGMLAFMVLIGTEQILPLFTEKVTLVSSSVSGMLLLPGAVCYAITAATCGRLYDTYGPKYIIICGALLMTVATIPYLFINKSTSLVFLAFFFALRMIGCACIFSTSMAEAFVDIKGTDTSQGTALNNALRQCSGAIAITSFVVIAKIPSSFTVGMHWANIFSMILSLLVLFTFLYYLKQKKA